MIINSVCWKEPRSCSFNFRFLEHKFDGIRSYCLFYEGRTHTFRLRFSIVSLLQYLEYPELESCAECGTDLPEEERGGDTSVFISAHFLVTRAFTVVDVYLYYSQAYLGSGVEGVDGRKGGATSLPSTIVRHLLACSYFLSLICFCHYIRDTSSLLSVATHLFITCFLFFICAKVQKVYCFIFIFLLFMIKAPRGWQSFREKQNKAVFLQVKVFYAAFS